MAWASSSSAGREALITSWMTLSRMVFWVTCSSCWVEMTTVWMRRTLPPSNSTVTWDFPVRTQPGQLAVLADFGQLPCQEVSEVDGGGHQFRGVAAGITEHQPLIARPAGVHTHGDVGALLVDGHHHRAGGVVESLDVVVIADVLDHIPHQRRHGNVGLGGDLARHQHESGGQERLAGHAAAGIILQGRIQHGIRDLVRHLVGVPFGDTLGCEQVTPLGGHAGLLGTPPSDDLEGTSSIPRGPLNLYLSDEAGGLAMF